MTHLVTHLITFLRGTSGSMSQELVYGLPLVFMLTIGSIGSAREMMEIEAAGIQSVFDALTVVAAAD